MTKKKKAGDSPLGFDTTFLGVRLPLPVPKSHVVTVELAYTHFTVLLAPDRKLAAATAVNIDGASLRDDVERTDDWRLDPRVPAVAQVGEELYADNDLDRGHLVRRMDPVWGPRQVAEHANKDTFMFTNAAPQVAKFNQSKQLWNGLEDYVLQHAQTRRLRLSVLTGPVFASDDPTYRGVQLPRRFWKVAAWAIDDPATAPGHRGGLAATGYLLEQTIDLGELDSRLTTLSRAPGLGAFRTFQVPIIDIAALTGLDLGPLPGADVLPQPSLSPSRASLRAGAALPDRWVELHEAAAIQLGQ